MARVRTIGTMGPATAAMSAGGDTVELFGQGTAAGPISGEVVVEPADLRARPQATVTFRHGR